MAQYRQNLSGDAAFKSFIPILTADIHFELTTEIASLLSETKVLMATLNEASTLLNKKQIDERILKEYELSCQLSSEEDLLI